SAQNCHRKIPRRDDERDTARPIVLVTFFAEDVLSEPRPADQTHLMRIKPAEIHRFANIAIRFRPGLADFENFERGELKTPAVHNIGGALEQSAARFK